MQKYLAILIVIICTVLLQAHSIPFWREQTDKLLVICGVLQLRERHYG